LWVWNFFGRLRISFGVTLDLDFLIDCILWLFPVVEEGGEGELGENLVESREFPDNSARVTIFG